jgi:hypothetical protein
MDLRYLKRGEIPIATRPRRSGRLPAAIALMWALPSLHAAAPPLENGRAVDRMVVPAGDPAAPRVADAARGSTARGAVRSSDAINRARNAMAECQERYRYVNDYTCTFVKRERIDGRLTPQHIMAMKARTNPRSLYFKFQQPNQGREAIYVQGRNRDRIVAHDVGLTRFIAGTMHLDPHGSMAMEDNRHPVTEAGIGNLIDTVARHWAVELTPGESVLAFQEDARVGNRRCTMIESVHPERGANFLFHKVRLYIDQEHGLPIRFEAYDWPRHAGGAPELVEEYTYMDLKLNVGLRDHDFDPANQQYSFGRF